MLDCVVGNGSGIRILYGFDDLHVELVGVDAELFDGSGPEGVACRQYDAASLLLQPVGDLGDGGGLAGAVDADEHDDGGLLLFGEPRVEIENVDAEDVADSFFHSELDDLLQGVLPAVLLAGEVVAYTDDDLLHDGICHIGFQEGDLQLVEDVVERVVLDLLAQERRAEHLVGSLVLALDGLALSVLFLLLFLGSGGRGGFGFGLRSGFFPLGFRYLFGNGLLDRSLGHRHLGDRRLLDGGCLGFFLVDRFGVELLAFFEKVLQLRLEGIEHFNHWALP